MSEQKEERALSQKKTKPEVNGAPLAVTDAERVTVVPEATEVTALPPEEIERMVVVVSAARRTLGTNRK